MTAEKLTEEELKANHAWNKIRRMSGFSRGYVKESPWYEGSAVLYGKSPGRDLLMYRIYKYPAVFKKKIFPFQEEHQRESSGCSPGKGKSLREFIYPGRLYGKPGFFSFGKNDI